MASQTRTESLVQYEFLSKFRIAENDFNLSEMSGKTPPRELFIWKPEHDCCFIRELLLVEPYMHKPQSKERGQAWKLVAENLNKLEQPKFRVAVRAVRDRFVKLIESFQQNEKEEILASGIEGKSYDETYRGLTDIHERTKEAKLLWEAANDKEREKQKEEKKRAEDMRKKTTESLSETKKRKEAEGLQEAIPKRRRKSSEALTLAEEGLRMKQVSIENELRLREQELEERRLSRESQQESVQCQQTFMANMQAQQQQFMLQLQQQNMQFLAAVTEMSKNKQ